MLSFQNIKSCWTVTRLIVRAFQCQLFSPGVFLSILVSSASYSLPQNVAEIAGKSTLGKDTLTSFGVGIFDIESHAMAGSSMTMGYLGFGCWH